MLIHKGSSALETDRLILRRFTEEDGKVIGGIGAFNISNVHLRCDVGFCIGKEYWNKGIMTEVLSEVIKYLFVDVGFNRIQSYHHSDNLTSGKVMIKSGMKYEGTMSQYQIDKEGNVTDFTMYSILKKDFKCL